MRPTFSAPAVSVSFGVGSMPASRMYWLSTSRVLRTCVMSLPLRRSSCWLTSALNSLSPSLPRNAMRLAACRASGS